MKRIKERRMICSKGIPRLRGVQSLGGCSITKENGIGGSLANGANLHRERKLRQVVVRDLLVPLKWPQRKRCIVRDQARDVMLQWERQR